MRKELLRLGRVATFMVTVLAVAFVVRALALTVQSSYFLISRSSIKKKCASIRPGMSTAEIDKVIHFGSVAFSGRTWPGQNLVYDMGDL
jgi:hypothetical protein